MTRSHPGPAHGWGRLWRRLHQAWTRWRRPPDIPAPLWQAVLKRYPVFERLTPWEQDQLQNLSAGFLASKTFSGGHGLAINDWMAVSIAAQACLPLLHWGPQALDWYADFVGVIVHPDAVVAQRRVTDAGGVVHQYREALTGEAMQGGPVMLAWSQIQGDTANAGQAGHSLVIHEFAHKLDMRHKGAYTPPNGCPALPAGFMGCPTPASAHRLWLETLTEAWQTHRQQVEMAERFGGTPPWLDAYGAASPVEFFAVACEAYFVNPSAFEKACPRLWPLFNAFFQRGQDPAVSDAVKPSTQPSGGAG